MTSSPDELRDWLSPLSLRAVGELAKGPADVRQLSKRLSAPYTTVQRWVNRLERAGVVFSERGENKRVVSLRQDYVAEAAVELHRRVELREALHAAPKDLANAVLNLVDNLDRLGVIEAHFYGSFATRTARKGSDVDVLLVVPDGSDAAKKIRDFAQAVSETILGEIHPVVMSASEFERKRQEKAPLVEQALSRGIRLRSFARTATGTI